MSNDWAEADDTEEQNENEEEDMEYVTVFKKPGRYYRNQVWLCFTFFKSPLCNIYIPTPLLGQDMTQGQFLSGV